MERVARSLVMVTVKSCDHGVGAFLWCEPGWC